MTAYLLSLNVCFQACNDDKQLDADQTNIYERVARCVGLLVTVSMASKLYTGHNRPKCDIIASHLTNMEKDKWQMKIVGRNKVLGSFRSRNADGNLSRNVHVLHWRFTTRFVYNWRPGER